ncbi:ATP-binding protein [Phenylobacterium kunshanense]|uniref:histidine kinase n=1 Tax=Phenylobacterium kunshanense TaxID=1445034 RepID=A0A328BIZ0_9CAUL|nr:ATP-binding protein [Phenylobacterium kunshanense]RAK66371.1 hybrid sensor histidine kinase/response regulator [Phenylobacterium kunshanense]
MPKTIKAPLPDSRPTWRRGRRYVSTRAGRDIPYELMSLRLQHFERAQVVTNTGSWEWDIPTNGLIWSDQIYRIFGLEPHVFEPTYPRFLARVHPDDRPLVEGAVQKALAREADYAIDHRIVLPDGSIRTVHELGLVEFDESGAPVRMTGAVTDVTERREAEAAHRETQEMLGSLLRVSPEAIVVTDQSANIMLFSAGAEAMFGYEGREVIGQPIEVLLPDEARAAHRLHVEGFGRGARESLRMHQRAEIRGRRKSGEVFPAEASLAKLSTRNGGVFTAIVRDLTQAKAAEQRLIHAREQAERANRAKSTFLANMSHEIRTPLNGVLGIASALVRSELSPTQREMVDLIGVSGRALEGLLNDILDLAKVEAGHIQIRREPFELGRVVRETALLFHERALEKGLAIEVDLPLSAEGLYEGDELRLRQVLSNLLSNAVKFTSAGAVRLSVEYVALGPIDGQLTFAVADTGIGFEPSIAPLLFERFEQADGSITRRFGGTGLGLAISKALVELMSGTISARSTPGAGSTFEVVLPLSRRDAPANGCESAGPRSAEDEEDRRLRVLLAEDHPINRRTVELLLQDLPVDLTCVEDGQQAVDAAEAGGWDVILMDMQMPVMDGLTAVRRIRQAELSRGLPRTPICVVTANALDRHRADSIDAGADEVLTKPICAEKLIGYLFNLEDD